MRLFVIFIMIIGICGCVTPQEGLKGLAGVSTKVLEDNRSSALVKVLNEDYKTAYERTQKILNGTSKVSIYAKDKRMIALYYEDPNTTPVGVFFREIDATHTQIEISSPGLYAREKIAKEIFAEKRRKPNEEKGKD